MKEFIDKLREESIYIKLESNDKFGGAIDIESLIKTLNSLNLSFKNFIKVELKDKQKNANPKTKTKEVKYFTDESQLLIVDLDFASFGAAITPNTITQAHTYTSIKNSIDVKKHAFENYKKEVIAGDFNDPKFISSVAAKYTEEERNAIFKPIYDNIINQRAFKFYYGNSKSNAKKLIKKPSSKEQLKKLIPDLPKETSPINEEKMYALYVTTSNENDLFGKKPKLSKVLAAEKLDYAVYPYQFNLIEFDDLRVIFNTRLSAHVSFEDEMFHINLEDLKINVWGETRDEAEDAFDFSICSLVENIYLEQDANLTPGALKIKDFLSQVIKEVKSI